jgi:hypothetical protein
MTLREFLQVEIWSKKTTRRIYVVFGMAFLVLGTILLAIVLWQEVSGHWLMAAERKAGMTALKEVDALQSFAGMSDEQYGTEEKQAATDVQRSDQVARTSRDKDVAELLYVYLSLTNDDREISKFSRPKAGSAGADTGTTIRTLTSTELHRALE